MLSKKLITYSLSQRIFIKKCTTPEKVLLRLLNDLYYDADVYGILEENGILEKMCKRRALMLILLPFLILNLKISELNNLNCGNYRD